MLRVSNLLLLVLLWPSVAGAQVIADHRVAAGFEQIPDSALPAASAIRLLFRHASVGGTIDDGLECLQGTRNHPEECTLYLDYHYDRRGWSFQPRGNSGWYGKVDDFATETERQLGDFDAFSFKYCYLDGLDGLEVPCGGTFDPDKVDAAWDTLRSNMESLEAAHPDKTFIWWTIPLTQVGQLCTETLNARIRSHVLQNGKVLFDIADIESHAPTGAHQTNVEGWEVAWRPYCGEQQPGAQACHPNWTGKLILAKAFWILMARLSGWDSEIVGRIDGLELAKMGDDIAFSWSPDPGAAGGYHLYETDLREHASCMRGEHPAYEPFAGIGQQPAQTFIYLDGIASGLSYYQVLGVAADGITEGPN